MLRKLLAVVSVFVATPKLGAILASIVVSSYAVFGHDAWAPEPAQLQAPLSGGNGTTGDARLVNTGGPTTVVKWPGSWAWMAGGPEDSGRPCSPVALPEGTITDWFIERRGNYARCIWWPTDGARLDADLAGTRSTAPAKTLSAEPTTVEVVQFPATWTYDTTLAAETYCASWPAPAGTAVGTIIVRSGNYAKCSY